ncbi:LysR family transcriptional regulator [Neisseria dentiae]|nr:LysR family transcriptional regulator [Neisseria dentiae]STZ52645.1 Uncharacterised protein [Neisseria dentiae]
MPDHLKKLPIAMKENLNDLRAFLMVAQTGSFTKAGA